MESPFRIPPARRDLVRRPDRVRLTFQVREVQPENRERGDSGGRAGPCAGDVAGSVPRACAADDGGGLPHQPVADNHLVSHLALVSGRMVGYVSWVPSLAILGSRGRMTMNCTSASLSIARGVGLTEPTGVGPVVAYDWDGTELWKGSLPNPYHLSLQMTAFYGAPGIVPISSFPPP